MSLPLNEVVLGDCGTVMAEWPGNSVDCVVTDPPYRIGFMGKSWDRALPPRRAFKQIFRVLKPGALAFVMSSPRQDVLWRMLAMLEEIGFELRQSFISWIFKTGFPKAFDVSKGIDRKLGSDRKIIREGFTSSDEQGRTYGKGLNPNFQERQLTAPSSDLAKRWEGWKSQTGLKPALECILMVNKPRSEPTIVDNVLKHGVGAINVDACRIPYQNEGDTRIGTTKIMHSKKEYNYSSYQYGSEHQAFNLIGRFPANLLVSDGALDTGETTKSRKRKTINPTTATIFGQGSGDQAHLTEYDDEGSPFRFFDLDAWAEHRGFLDVAKPSKAERDMGLWNQPLIVPKSKFNLNDGSKDMRFDGVIPTPRRNIHPTCKPVKLMAYLISLGCPQDGIVVDPFLGSGTTCIAAKQLRRKWIGIEINPEYAELAEDRINIKGPLDQFLD